jgi:hypothetical protein
VKHVDLCHLPERSDPWSLTSARSRVKPLATAQRPLPFSSRTSGAG